MHGAGCRRDTVTTPQGTPAPHRPQARRQHHLPHHLRLDDVELAGQRPVLWCRPGPLRGEPLPPRPRRALATGRKREDHRLWHQRALPQFARRLRHPARQGVRPLLASHHPLHRFAVIRRWLPLRLSRDQVRPSARLHFGRHRFERLLRVGGSHQSGLSGGVAMSRARDASRGL
jgi:hypothetical protein